MYNNYTLFSIQPFQGCHASCVIQPGVDHPGLLFIKSFQDFSGTTHNPGAMYNSETTYNPRTTYNFETMLILETIINMKTVVKKRVLIILVGVGLTGLKSFLPWNSAYEPV